MERLTRLQAWVEQVLPEPLRALAPASADASFRRYFRATTEGGSYIVMDAPPSHEDCRPYIHVARLFRAAGANTPEILAQDLQQGFLLLTDFGNATYLHALGSPTPCRNESDSAAAAVGLADFAEPGAHACADNADRLYRDANAALIRIQVASRAGELPAYDRELLLRELRLFPDWYVGRHLRCELAPDQRRVLEDSFEAILANNLAQPQVYVHRDWHSRNLMVTEPNPGVLDFQDAVYGPITYDLVSLYKDAYIYWEEERVLDWVIRYWESARRAGLPVHADFAAFFRDFEWMGVQRHLKVLGIFARLYHRDGKDGYLKDMPLVLHYLRRACERYGELHGLLRLLDAIEGRQPQAGYTF